MQNTSIFGARLPEATDPAQVRQDLGFNAQLLENANKHSIALQNNSSTTAYTSDFPLAAYINGHSFIFIPSLTNTGAVTINFNSLGVKNVYNSAGTVQLSTANDLIAFNTYLLTYDSSIAGGGGFKSILLSENRIFITPTAFTDAIASGATLTKTIPIGNNKKYGSVIIFNNSSATTIYQSIKVDFSAVNTSALINGYSLGGGSGFGTSWTRNTLGKITNLISPDYYFGYAITGYFKILIDECYIDGENLKIIFRNTDTVTRNLNCKIEGEVW